MYCEGLGERETTYVVVGLNRALLVRVVRVTVVLVEPAGERHDRVGHHVGGPGGGVPAEAQRHLRVLQRCLVGGDGQRGGASRRHRGAAGDLQRRHGAVLQWWSAPSSGTRPSNPCLRRWTWRWSCSVARWWWRGSAPSPRSRSAPAGIVADVGGVTTLSGPAVPPGVRLTVTSEVDVVGGADDEVRRLARRDLVRDRLDRERRRGVVRHQEPASTA